MNLLFDIGGTNTRLATSDQKGIIKESIYPTPPLFEDGLKMLSQKGKELLGSEAPQIVAGGIAGRFNLEMTGVVASRNLTGWEGKNLKGSLEKLLGSPVILQNDAAVGGLGEAHYGAGRGYGIVAFITVGTGVGGARVVNGVIDNNAQGFEPGKQIVDPQSGQSLEELISGRALQEKYNVPSADRIKDEKVWIEAEKIFSYGLNNTAAFWSPDVIVVGGSVINEWGINLNKAISHLEKNTRLSKLPKVVKGELGNKCGLYGAMVLAQKARE